MSGTATKEKLTVRHLLVVLTGIMITFGCSALCFSTWGLFQPVVAEGLGVEVTAFAMYVTVMYLTMTIASPFAGKLLQTMDIRILLSASAALVGCAFLLMSFSNTIVLFYVAAVMLGLGEITILWLAIPTLINRWFVERAGFFIGLCMAFTGHRRRHLVRRVHRADRLGRRLPHDLPHLGRHRARHEPALHAVLRAQLSRGLRAGPLRRLHAEGGLGR